MIFPIFRKVLSVFDSDFSILTVYGTESLTNIVSTLLFDIYRSLNKRRYFSLKTVSPFRNTDTLSYKKTESVCIKLSVFAMYLSWYSTCGMYFTVVHLQKNKNIIKEMVHIANRLQ